MIVRRLDGELIVFKQVDHASLSGYFAGLWGNRQFAMPAVKDSVVFGTGHHDDGWTHSDEDVQFDEVTRRPLHFMDLPIEEHVPLYREGVLSVAEKDLYAGLLVGMHWTGIYANRWGLQPPLFGISGRSSDAFAIKEAAILEEEARWARAKRQLIGVSELRSRWEGDLWHSFDLLQFFDLLSLLVCLAPRDVDAAPVGRGSERVGLTIRSFDRLVADRYFPVRPRRGDDPVTLRITMCGGGTAVIDPFPFGEDGFVADVAGVAIPDRDYSDVDEVRQAVGAGRRTSMSCVIASGR